MKMKKILILLVLIFPFIVLSQSEPTDELRYSRESKAVYQGTRKMSMDDLFVRMRPYPKSFQLLESARDCFFYSTVFATAGAIPLGYVVADKLLNNNVNWPVLATGIGLVGIAIPLNVRYKKQLQRSVISFNEEVKNTAQLESRLSFSICASATGVGFRVRL